jgi:TonB family protein
MGKSFVVLICAVSLLRSQEQPPNRPQLKRVGATPLIDQRNMVGFRPIDPVWPNLAEIQPNPPDGIRVAVSITVADGKPQDIQVLEGVRPFTEVVVHGMAQWRFEMPSDGTSPVCFDTTFESIGGKFLVSQVEVHLPDEHETPLQVVYKPTPIYPSEAMSAGIEGIVQCWANVNSDGTVNDSGVIRGPVSLRQSALDTVRQWRFKPVAGLPRRVSVPIVFLLPFGHGTALEPTVRCQGRLEIQQTYCWDLDDGVVGHTGEPCEAPYDLMYRAVRTPMNAIHRYLVPKNGAKVAVLGSTAVGYEGCRSANFSSEHGVVLDDSLKGHFFCAQTNEGRYSEFSIDDLYAVSPDSHVLTLVITYTTWE